VMVRLQPRSFTVVVGAAFIKRFMRLLNDPHRGFDSANYKTNPISSRCWAKFHSEEVKMRRDSSALLAPGTVDCKNCREVSVKKRGRLCGGRRRRTWLG
jgi:hypothetical protein